MTPDDIPGHHGGNDGGAWFGLMAASTVLMMIVLLAAAALLLWRSGHLSRWLPLGRPSPEADAKRVLAERFARGDLTSEEFMERASVLNWTPGSESLPPRRHRRVGR